VRPYDGGFGKPIAWDVDLLDGYQHKFLKRADQNSIGDDGFLGFHDFDIVPTLWRLRPDVLWVFGYAFLTHQMAAWWQYIHRAPLLVREEQTLLHPRTWWKRVIKQVALGALLRGQRGLYIGSRNMLWFRKYGITTSNLYFTPYAVDNDSLAAEAARMRPQKRTIRDSFGIGWDDGPVILFVGRLVPKKQPEFLIDAFKRVREMKHCTLLIVGSGPLEDMLRLKVADENVPNVHFQGFMNQTEISQAYVAADIFVLPSKEHETWGVVVNEAMNFQLPIVVSDMVGCAVDLVKHGENGFVFSSDSLDQLVEYLLTLVDSAELRHIMGLRSSQRIRGFSYDVSADGVVRAISAAVGGERWRRAGG